MLGAVFRGKLSGADGEPSPYHGSLRSLSDFGSYRPAPAAEPQRPSLVVHDAEVLLTDDDESASSASESGTDQVTESVAQTHSRAAPPSAPKAALCDGSTAGLVAPPLPAPHGPMHTSLLTAPMWRGVPSGALQIAHPGMMVLSRSSRDDVHNGTLGTTHCSATLSTIDPIHILVIGGPQVGKSTFINAYRSAVCPSDDWPMNPTGMCGVFGTVSVLACPRSSRGAAQWDLVDTPGRVYCDLKSSDSNDSMLLQLLVEGLPWKTKLVGPGSKSVAELSAIEPCPQNKASHVVVVLSATDLMEDAGWSIRSSLGLANRFVPGGNAGFMVESTRWLISRVRELMNDVAPSVVVTKMDLFGGASNAQSRGIVIKCLESCISPERIFFLGCPPTAPELLHATRRRMPQADGAHDLRRMHREIINNVRWNASMSDDV